MILNTNSNPATIPSLFLRTRHKKLDSASLIPTNHSINSRFIEGLFLDDTSWEPLLLFLKALLSQKDVVKSTTSI